MSVIYLYPSLDAASGIEYSQASDDYRFSQSESSGEERVFKDHARLYHRNQMNFLNLGENHAVIEIVLLP